LINLVSYGDISLYSGLDFAIQACALLKDDGIDFHYTIYTDDISNEMIRFNIFDLNLEDQITVKGKDKVKVDKDSVILFSSTKIEEQVLEDINSFHSKGLLVIASTVLAEKIDIYNNIYHFKSWSASSIVNCIKNNLL